MKLRFLVLFGILVVIIVGLLAAFGGFEKYPAAPSPAPALEQYSSEDGFSFMYPDTYEISSQTGDLVNGDTLVLRPKGIAVPDNSEYPPSIFVRVIRSATTTLGQWVRTSPASYFAPGSGTLASTTVGGEPALSYRYSGLYENDAVAVMHGGKIFVFVGEWGSETDPIRADFQNLITSVQFTQ